MTCRKHVRALADRLEDMAARHHDWSTAAALPAPGEIGATLPLDVGQFGHIFENQVRMSAPGIPQIAWFGCTRRLPRRLGLAYIPALCDEVGIVKGTAAHAYLGGTDA